MSTALYRTDSPYVPRPIETERRAPYLTALPQQAKPKRVLIASTGVDSAIESEGPYLTSLTRALTALGHNVEIITAGAGNDELRGLCTLTDVTEPLRRLKLPPSLSRFVERQTKKWSGALFHAGLFWHLCRNPGRYDAVHDNQSLTAGSWLLTRLGLAIIGIVHDPEMTRPSGRTGWKQYRAIIASSSNVFDQVRDECGVSERMLTVVPRGNTERGARSALVLNYLLARIS
jgi:hypothetical protein